MNDFNNYISNILKNKLHWDNVTSPSITPLTEGGSERNFYRVMSDTKNVVYMRYSDEKEENTFYYDIAELLQSLRINIADIYYKDDGNIFLQDLGDVHLYNLVTRYVEDRIVDYYYKSVDQLLKLHSEGASLYEKKRFKISKQFDYSLYRWESAYFLDNLIENYFSLKLNESTKRELEKDFHFLADILSEEKKVLIHRDCQSKNIMVREGVVYFIDFQGLRYGLPQYDLASLLEDPYVNLSKKLKDKLLSYYVNELPQEVKKSDFLTLYTYCAMQRLMQALGAYAFLGLKKGKKEFLQYIPNALGRLERILDKQSGFVGFKSLLRQLSEHE